METQRPRQPPEGVDQARAQILALVREIELLADSNVAADLFFPEYLKRLALALGADAAAVWLLDERREMKIRHYVQRAPLGVFENPQQHGKFQKLLQEAIASGGVRVYRQGDPRTAELPTPHVQIIGALQQGTTPLGVLHILQRAEAPEEARAGYLQFVEQMCSFVPRYFRSQEQPAAQLQAGQDLADLRRVLLELHGTLNLPEIASIAANDGAKFLGCDRVSVLEQYGARLIVQGVSGQEGVNPRSNLVRLMTRLAEQVLATGERLQYTGKPEGLPPQIEEPLAEFLDVSRSRLLTVVPILPREVPAAARPEGAAAEPRRETARKKPLGALIVEQVTDARLRPDFETRLEVLTEHVGQALVNAQELRQVPLMPLWKFLAEQTALLKGRRLAQAVAVVVALALVAGAFALVPWDYRVEGKGRLMPVVRQGIFAPQDGDVTDVQVTRNGQAVRAGELLLRMRNQELHARWLATSAELDEKSKQHVALQSELSVAARNLPPEEVVRLEGRIAQARIEAEGAAKRLAALTELERALDVHAPISGVVATFQVSQLLRNRPVRRGELLLEVMDRDGPWRLELEVPESRLGHILEGQKKRGETALPVEYVLATKAETTYAAQVEALATRSVSSEEAGTVVEVFAKLDGAQVPADPRIGAEVIAKINCGKRSLGYVLFGDVVEFIRKRWWW